MKDRAARIRTNSYYEADARLLLNTLGLIII